MRATVLQMSLAEPGDSGIMATLLCLREAIQCHMPDADELQALSSIAWQNRRMLTRSKPVLNSHLCRHSTMLEGHEPAKIRTNSYLKFLGQMMCLD